MVDKDGFIYIKWHIDDVKFVAQQHHNLTLSNEEATKILEQVEKDHDPALGIDWAIINYYIQTRNDY
jgi:hypothetical protein